MNCLITKNKVIEIPAGSMHSVTCKHHLKITILTFFNRGGVRVMFHNGTMAIEHYTEPNDFQTKVVKRLLRNNVVYRVITPTDVKHSFSRPIRTVTL